MPARMVVELPAGHKVYFGGSGSETGLAEVSVADDIATATGEKFKGALGALADLGSGLIDYSQKMTMAAMQMADMNV